MNRNGIKLSCVTLALMVTLSSLAFLGSVSGQPAKPRVYVDPPNNVFYTDTTMVGDKFTVNITADWATPGLYGFEFKIVYDKTLLKAVNESGYPSNIKSGFWIDSIVPAAANGSINLDEGSISYAASLQGDDRRIGIGLLAQASFQIIAPPPAGQNVSCALAFKEYTMVNPDTGEAYDPATYDIISGTYLYSAPPPPHYLKVEPALSSVSDVGDLFNISVTMHDVDPAFKITGVEFKLSYNTTVFETKPEWVTEGDFFKSHGPTFFQQIVEDDYVLVGILLLPNEATGEPPATFPEGTGILATIMFNVTSKPDKLTSFPLTLSEVTIIDVDNNIVPYRRLENGEVLLPAKPEDLNTDGKIDILDITIFAKAFGSTPASLRWNPKADVNRDGKVNILDGVLVAKAFGWKA